MAFDFPASPTVGQQFTPAGGPTYVWNGYAWVVATGAYTLISDTPPASPTNGSLWWESDTGTLWIYYSDGTSNQWVAASGGGGNVLPGQLVLIQRQDVSSAVATVDFTSGIDATYDEYVFKFYGVDLSADAGLAVQFSSNNGGSWVATANYQVGYRYIGSASTAADAQSQTGTSWGLSPVHAGSSPILTMAGSLKLFIPSNTTYAKNVLFDLTGFGPTIGAFRVTGNATYVASTAAINGIRFFMTSGNFTAGTFILYGVKK